MAILSTGLTTHIYNNHLKSAMLLAGFPVLLLAMLGGFIGGINAWAQRSGPYRQIDWARAYEAAVDGVLAYGHYMVLGAGLWFVIAFFFHGRMMRAASGAQSVTRTQMPRIYNMLENLCISRGIPMPQFEVIDSPGMNAFATGLSDKSYRIVLTRGLIDSLADDELEAVIAHELTHIMNRDVRLLIIAVVFVGMISFFAQIAFRSVIFGGRSHYGMRRRRRDNNGSGAMVMFIALGILALGYLFAVVIRFALSRKREYLADAGAVELTKNPEAMMRALMRISGHDNVQGMPNEVQQMCIENAHSFMGVFATHPPIEQRIKAISDMTRTPIPTLSVTLRRPPRRPWGEAVKK